MMLLLFTIGDDRYGLDVAQVVEVIPQVALRKMPRFPEHVAGLLNYHGKGVPVIDVLSLMCGRSSRAWLSTRIVLINYRTPTGGVHLLGILAERVTATVKLPKTAFSPAGVGCAEAPFLDEIAVDQHGMIQRIDIDKLLSSDTSAILFEASDATG